MKKFVFFLFAVILSSAGFAQRELGENEHYATLIYSNGNETEVVLLQNLNIPWFYQKKIFTVEKNFFESGAKIKNKNKIAFKAKELKGYKIGSQMYETRKYSDFAALGAASLPTNYFLEVVVHGKVTMYKYYEKPYNTEGSAPLSSAELNEKFLNNPQLLVWKEGQKFKEVSLIKLTNYFGDNERVMEKYANGEYGNKAIDPEKSVVGNLWNKLDEDKEDFIKKMVKDYNSDNAL